MGLISFIVALGLGSSVVRAACSKNLVIDDFSKWASRTNSLGSYTSDDNTMTSISASGGFLTFTPRANSYFYEPFSCRKTTADGYNAISFTAQGPAAGSSLTLEIQHQSTCASGAGGYQSAFTSVTGLSMSAQTVTVPLSSFSGARLDFVKAFSWSGFSVQGKQWKIGNIQFVCSAGGGSQSSSSAGSTSRSTSPTSSLPGSTTRLSTTSSSTRVSTTSSSRTTTNAPSTLISSTTSTQPSASGVCKNLVIDDWESQSRLTFLYYNAMLKATSDEGSMKSIVVSASNTVTLTPKDTSSYFYSLLGCTNAQNVYGGISFRINAPRGAAFAIQLASTSTCGGQEDKFSYRSTADLGWTFDGTTKLYSFPFSKFPEVDITKLNSIFFTQLSGAVTFGPMAFYCGNTVSEYIPPTTPPPTGATPTVPAPAGPTSARLVIDDFSNQNQNALGNWHGADSGMTLTWGTRKLTIKSTDPDYSFYTNIAATCRDLTSFEGGYLHIAYSGSNKFTVALQQHNQQCNENIAPFPETWDSLEAARYASATDIYIPLAHFNIERTRVIGVALKGFYTADPVELTKIEIVDKVPAGFTIPTKLPSGNLVFACKRPNSFAFAIDDGVPALAQQVMDIIREENIKVTFFTVGAPLEDLSTNLSAIYRDMMGRGHQLALHSYTHPKMEGLPDYDAIDWEYNRDIQAVKAQLDGLHTSYFRPPFGNEGARMRQRLAATTGDSSPYIVNWSVDVEDWLWAEGPTPEKQLDAFKRDVNKGGNLVVLHYLYPSTVSYLRQFIQIAKATGKQLMRVDQCMMDPNAPPVP
ncbi:glycosyl hydrolase [Magnaporthiopsis poae ATCC 64411]|uniref:Glycosyl hydrolase n=1 Tax=Magnaporthiopsis poae (strain ATCC 64411 / 73-15) TaxID=644358 RepID=A0A0C4DM60_MAGP6|nr:glycosyl hydrolase [Magnaporthiopsis poae ATCC 64411]